MTTKVGIHITSNNQSMLSNYTTALPSKSRPRASHERKNLVLTTNFVGIEICNAEWQSRGIPEMLFKLIGIHMTTLLTVAEYATSLNKSSAERACLVLASALYPAWIAFNITFRLLSTLLRMVLLAVSGIALVSVPEHLRRICSLCVGILCTPSFQSGLRLPPRYFSSLITG